MRDNFQIHISGLIRKDPKPVCRTLNTVNVIKVHEEVWRKALELSQGDIRRLHVRSAEEVIVYNNAKWERSYTP